MAHKRKRDDNGVNWGEVDIWTEVSLWLPAKSVILVAESIPHLKSTLIVDSIWREVVFRELKISSSTGISNGGNPWIELYTAARSGCVYDNPRQVMKNQTIHCKKVGAFVVESEACVFIEPSSIQDNSTTQVITLKKIKSGIWIVEKNHIRGCLAPVQHQRSKNCNCGDKVTVDLRHIELLCLEEYKSKKLKFKRVESDMSNHSDYWQLAIFDEKYYEATSSATDVFPADGRKTKCSPHGIAFKWKQEKKVLENDQKTGVSILKLPNGGPVVAVRIYVIGV